MKSGLNCKGEQAQLNQIAVQVLVIIIRNQNHLLGNAVKFTEQGEVCIRCVRDHGWLAIAVRDTGVGIDPFLTLILKPGPRLMPGRKIGNHKSASVEAFKA